MPANIHEEDLTPDGPKNARPLSEITEQSEFSELLKLSNVS